MYSSFNRLIELAKKTGDRLIIHDEFMGSDVVIMDIDQYEKLWEKQQEVESDVRGLSGRGLLDKINRDIAVWRADQDLEDEYEREMMLDDDLPPWGEPWENGYNDDWYHIGDVMNERSKDQPSSRAQVEGKIKRSEDHGFDWDFEDEEDETETKNSELGTENKSDSWNFDSDDFDLNTPVADEIKIEDLPFDFGLNDFETKQVPHQEQSFDSYFSEKPLEDEPVFYEEPV